MTPSDGGWRLLGTGERLQPGDWGQNPETRAWEPIDPFLARERAQLGDARYCWVYCRPMTPAEKHSEELLEALENLENDDGSIPAHAWALVRAAIKKAGGRKP